MKASHLLTIDRNSADVIYSADTEREVHTRVSLKQHEDRIFVSERESHIPQPCVSVSKCETRVLPVPKCDFCVFSTKHDVRVLRQTQPTFEDRVSTPCEVRVSIKEREECIQTGMSLSHKEPKNPHLHGFKVTSSDVPATDWRDYLKRKRSVHQITPRCHYDQLISAILSDCHCGFQITKPSVFNWLSVASNSAKRRRS